MVSRTQLIREQQQRQRKLSRARQLQVNRERQQAQLRGQELTQQQTQQVSEEERQKKFEEEQRKLEEQFQREIEEQKKKDVSFAKKKVEEYKQKIRTQEGSRKDKSVEYRIAWEEGVRLVEAGYSLQSVQTWVSQRASGQIAKSLERERYQKELAVYQERLREQQQKQAVIEQAKFPSELSIVPTADVKGLLGDRKEKQPVMDLGKPIISTQEAEQFSEQKLQKFRVLPQIPVVSKEGLPENFQIFSSEEDFGGYGRSQVVDVSTDRKGFERTTQDISGFGGLDVGGYGKPLVSPSEAERISEKDIGRVQIVMEDQQPSLVPSAPQKPFFESLSDIFSIRTQEMKEKQAPFTERVLGEKGHTLPFGLQPAVNIARGEIGEEEQKIITGEKFSPFVPAFYLGAKISEIDFVRETFDKVIEDTPLEEEEVQEKIVNVLVPLTAGLQLGTFFEPAFRTGGTKQKQKLTEQEKISKQLSKNRFDDLADELNYAREGNVFRSKTLGEQTDDVTRILDKIKNLPANERAKTLEAWVKGMNKIYGKARTKVILKEWANQQGYSASITSKGVKVKVSPQKEFLFPDIPQIKGAGGITGAFSQEAIAQEGKQKDIFQLLLGTSPKEKQKEREKQMLSLGLGLETIQKARTGQAQISKQDTALASALGSILGTPTSLKTPQKHAPRLSTPIKRTFPKEKKPFYFRFPSIEDRRLLPIGLSKGNYDVYLKSKGKSKKITKKPLPLKQALNLGSWGADSTLSAQFSLKKSKQKPAKRSSLKVPPNYFRHHAHKFRNYKMRKGEKIPLRNRFIERASYRLDNPNEVRRIHIEKWLSQQRRGLKQRQTRKGFNNMFDFGYNPSRKQTRKKSNVDRIMGYDKKLAKVFGI